MALLRTVSKSDIDAALVEAGAGDGGVLPIAQLALLLSARVRPGLDIARYQAFLTRLASDAEALGQDADQRPPEVRLAALLADTHGFAGDAESYDDLRNADLTHVIRRRRGLPVALGILYIHAARAAGWSMAGLSFPGHFLVRLTAGRQRAVLDPFHGGVALDTAALRGLLKAVAGPTEELTAEHHAAVGDRSVLLRLRNNVKLRHLRAGRLAEAALELEGMLRLAPNAIGLLHEYGSIQAECGDLGEARAALARVLELGPSAGLGPAALQKTVGQLRALEKRLN